MKARTKVLLVVVELIQILLVVLSVVNNKATVENLKVQETYAHIEKYTEDYFGLLKEVQVKGTESRMTVLVSFVPEAGSFIVKEDLYKEVARHAVDIRKFYPEVDTFSYEVLQDDMKETVMTLEISGTDIAYLYGQFHLEQVREIAGEETNYGGLFTEIVETDESRTWRERVEPDAQVP